MLQHNAGAASLRATPPTAAFSLAAPEMHHQAPQRHPGDHRPEPHVQRDTDRVVPCRQRSEQNEGAAAVGPTALLLGPSSGVTSGSACHQNQI